MLSLTSSLIYPYFFVYLWIGENWSDFRSSNLIFNRSTYLVHAKSTDELISFGFSDCSVRSLVSVIALSESLSHNEKNDFTFWLIFSLKNLNLGLSENLSERLIQKVKWPAWWQRHHTTVYTTSTRSLHSSAPTGSRTRELSISSLVLHRCTTATAHNPLETSPGEYPPRENHHGGNSRGSVRVMTTPRGSDRVRSTVW